MGTSPTYGPKSDIFSLGCVMFQLCELRLAFKSKRRDVVPPMTSAYSPDLKALIRDCMTLKPSSRPNTSTVHIRFTSINRAISPNQYAPRGQQRQRLGAQKNIGDNSYSSRSLPSTSSGEQSSSTSAATSTATWTIVSTAKAVRTTVIVGAFVKYFFSL